jgi:hypothetical protein
MRARFATLNFPYDAPISEEFVLTDGVPAVTSTVWAVLPT